jgi:chromosome segregation ATPase
VFNKLKTEPKTSIAGAIEEVKAAIDKRQLQLELLLSQQSELNLEVVQSQQELEEASLRLNQLEIEAGRQQLEAELEAELKQLRPIADCINALSDELSEALAVYRRRVDELKGRSQFGRVFAVDRNLQQFTLPQIKHQLGSENFTLESRSIQVNR